MPVVSNGRIRSAESVAFADEVIECKKNKGMWPTIELLLGYWMKKSPEDFKAFKVQVDETRSNLRDSRFGQTPDKNMERRLTVMMPEALHNMVRAIYPSDELKMDKKFFAEFAKHFPMFQLPSSL